VSDWPPDVRERALELWQSEGMAKAHAETGVPKSTINRWRTAAGLEPGASDANEQTRHATEARLAQQAEKRVTLQELFLDKAIDMLKRMDEKHTDFKGRDAVEVHFEKAPSGACQQYATAAAILIDKFRLEVGEVTDRHGIDNPAGHVAAARARLRALPGGARSRTG